MADRLSKAKIIKAAIESGGIVTATAKSLKTTTKTVRRYRDKYPEVAAAFEKGKDEALDLVESKLLQKAKAGDMRAIRFFLSTQGADRGYNLQLVIARELAKLKDSDSKAGLDAFIESMKELRRGD